MKTYQITDNIRLELSHPLHAVALYKAVNRNKNHLRTFLTWVDKMTNVEDFEKYLIHCANEHNEGKEASYNIFKDERLIGRIGLHQIDSNNKNASIGYWLDKKEEGHGLMTTATRILLNHAFTVLDLHRVEILTATQNTKSAAIPVRLGFRQEGILRETEKHNDMFFDLTIFSILKKEWEPLP